LGSGRSIQPELKDWVVVLKPRRPALKPTCETVFVCQSARIKPIPVQKGKTP
jgi:hypothetical protein